jgi:F420-non-reducing hydrogenase iron-sulfur subunit
MSVPAHDGAAPRVIGFVCDWAIAAGDLADEAGRLRAHPSVVLIRVPCSGFIRPAWLEDTLKAGAQGVFVVGCPYGDCLNREGNYLMRERIDQLQRRLQRRKVEPERLVMMAHGLHDREAFLAEVSAMLEALRGLGGRAQPTPAARTAQTPAPAEGGGR